MDASVPSRTEGTKTALHGVGRFALPAAVVVSATAYAAMRVPGAFQVHRSFATMCARLAMQPGDWPCRIGVAASAEAFIGAALLTGLALALPAAVLAASGRRLLFLVPLLVPVAVAAAWSVGTSLASASSSNPADGFLIATPGGALWADSGRSFWATHTTAVLAVSLVLLALPATVVAVRARPRRRTHSANGTDAGAFAALMVCLAAAAGTVAAGKAMQLVGDDSAWAVPVGVIFAFGMLLSTDRRWWPWVLAPVAVLLSGGPSLALQQSLWRFQNFSRFGLAIPLAAVGLIACAWEPLAERLERRMAERRRRRRLDEDDDGYADEDDDEADEPALVQVGRLRRPAASSGPTRELRPTVVANALAAGMMAVALVMFAADPSGAQVAQSLPTYLGVRVRAEDLRTHLDLIRALAAADTYLASHGSYAGFDAAAGKALAPSLRWHNGLFEQDPGAPDAVVAIVSSPSGSVQLAEVAASGNAFCLRPDPRISAVTDGSGVAGTPRQALAKAVAACGSEPLDFSTWFRPVPVTNLCFGADPLTLPICRSVQRTLRRDLPATWIVGTGTTGAGGGW